MSGLTKRHQIYTVAEATEGVYQAPSPSGLRLAYDPQVTVDFEEHERNTVADSLDMNPSEMGRELLNWTFGIDFGFAGATGVLADEPLWTLYLLACGYTRHRVMKVAAPAPTVADITHREVLTAAGSGATGIAVGNYLIAGKTYDGILYIPTDEKEMTTLDVITGTGTGTTTATGVSVQVGWAYLPSSDVVHVIEAGSWSPRVPEPFEFFVGGTSGAIGKHLFTRTIAGQTMVFYEPVLGTFNGTEVLVSTLQPFTSSTSTTAGAADGNYSVALASLLDGVAFLGRGARGTFNLPLVAGAPARFQFQFSGIKEAILDLPNHTGENPDFGRGIRFQSARMYVGAYKPRLQNFSLDQGNTLVLRDNQDLAHGAEAFRITARDPGGAMDPELRSLIGGKDWFAEVAASTLSDIRMRFGTAEDDLGTTAHTVGGTTWLDVPAAQYTQVTPGDRDGMSTAAGTYKARRLGWYGDDSVAFFVL